MGTVNVDNGPVNKCSAVNGLNGDRTYASLSCCKSETYEFECITVYGEGTIGMSTAQCPDTYFMASCSGFAPWRSTNAWYINDTDVCISRDRDGTKQTWATAICCKVEEPTPMPTISPTTLPS